MKKLILVAALVAAPAFAQEASGPTINGAVELNVQAGQNLNAAVGNQSKASQALGSIESGNIEGNVETVVVADQNLNAAVGNKSCADQQVGTIGKKSSC